VRIFYGMLDQAAVNARILLKCKLKSDNSTEKSTAIMCLENVYMYLIKPYIIERFKMPTLRRDIKTGIAAILNIDPQKTTHERIQLPTRQRCSVCPRKEDKKTNVACSSCQAPICEEHRLNFCHSCVGN